MVNMYDRAAPAAVAASAASVLQCDDLLPEILLRLGFPQFLVRAALVSKRWLIHVSDPVFLRRFRDRHPPRLLGFYVDYPFGTYEFVPLPQPEELAAYSRNAASSCKDTFADPEGFKWIKHCRNGRLIIESGEYRTSKYTLLAPLLARGSESVLPPVRKFNNIFLPDDGGRYGITTVRILEVGRKFSAEVRVLGSGGWGVPATAVKVIEPAYPTPRFYSVLPPVHGKIFVVTTFGYMLGLDLTTPHIFILELPHGVLRNFMLSTAPNSGLYLICTKGFQIHVWLHHMTADNYGADEWRMVDTFCVRGACASTAGNIWPDSFDVVAVGDNADFVFLDHRASGVVFYVHMRRKVVEKVYQRVPHGRVTNLPIVPLMMSWPPIFPSRNLTQNQEE